MTRSKFGRRRREERSLKENGEPKESDIEKWKRTSAEVTYELKAFHELTIQVDNDLKVEVMILQGIAEICGVKLENNLKYYFGSHSNVTIFTYHGCSISVIKGSSTTCIETSNETSVDTLLNIHLSLEEFRAEALKSKSPMPVTLCIGGTQSGRITAVETLLNYNLRQASDEDKKIFYVDLNLSQNLLSIPGSIGACIAHNPPSVREGFLSNLKNCVIYCFGHTNPLDDIGLFKFQMQKLAELIKARREKFRKLEVLINAPIWTQGSGYKLLLKTCQDFQVTHVIVCESCTTYNQLIEDLPPFVKIIHTSRLISSTLKIIPRLRREQSDQIMEYFFGTTSQPFTPYRIELEFDQVKVFTIEKIVPNSGKRARSKATSIELKVRHENAIMGVVHVPLVENPKPEDFYRTVIQHYVAVFHVSTGRATVQIISPVPRSTFCSPVCMILTDQKLSDSFDSKPLIVDLLEKASNRERSRTRDKRKEGEKPAKSSERDKGKEKKVKEGEAEKKASKEDKEKE
ncbi:protein CLP1 homolog [Diaphorina citri]|uniref:Protein CLP1 homolog n=1 Tax=Diaphorina citri TaxID=121845 RepID=A0A1S3D9E6_DIACI|nr:protein CLP1 homolog [Diaphorina citri]XP_008477166.1 protein CLP1 homolog [Diaphorina citri]